jgi:hypothetical protein
MCVCKVNASNLCCTMHSTVYELPLRVFSDVPLWNSAEYGIYTELVLFRVIPRTFYCSIPRNSAEFHMGSCIQNSVYLQISPLHFALCSRESSLKILEDSLGPYRDNQVKKITYGGPTTYYLHRSF